MASIFDLYGIKEVADVVFWTTEEPRVPVLYLDTLKVSTIEETAEQTEARGGKGNPPLIIWDYGKEITLTLEDAVFSMKSMSVMHTHHFGSVNTASTAIQNTGAVEKVKRFTTLPNGAIPASAEIPEDAVIYDEYSSVVSRDNILAKTTYLARWTQVVNGSTITITSEDFPGTYYITGDTYARSQATGEDEFFQFEIPLAKVNPEQTITMQADGDPSTFSMTVRVMRPADGVMMKFTKYEKATSINYSISRGTDAEEQTVAVNAQKTLNPVVSPTGSAIVWSSSDETKATVVNGVVSGVLATGAGTPVVITATLADDSSKSVSYNFTVTAE